MKSHFTRIALAGLIGAWAATTIQAANLLLNPGFEYCPAGQTTSLPGWTSYGPNNYGETGASAHSGTNYFKAYQSFSSATNVGGIYQDYISGPGADYAADGWAFTPSGDVIAGQNLSWIEVSFRDADGAMLALYRSSMIGTNAMAKGIFPSNKWVDLAVTNRYDPATLQFLGSTNSLVAPAGTYFVRYQLVFQGDPYNSRGSMYYDDLNLVQTGGAPYGNWNIVWSDEFNSNSINNKVWTYDLGAGGWGNSELETYTSSSENSFVSNGLLNIVVQHPSTSTYTSARMKSEGLASWKYGRFEWRARMPAGLGFWPALWMLGTNISVQGVGWPACGEIDVVEAQGSDQTMIQGSLHSGSDETAKYYLLGSDSVTNFHTYTLDWGTNTLTWYVDGHRYQSQNQWSGPGGAYPAPFNQPFFIIMNVAVGGQYLGNPSVSNINANTSFPAAMQVDYVRVYNQTSPLALSTATTNSHVMLSWPSNIVCHLQSLVDASSLAASNTWADLGATVAPYAVATTNKLALYRLASP